jgi:hypothetical protein
MTTKKTTSLPLRRRLAATFGAATIAASSLVAVGGTVAAPEADAGDRRASTYEYLILPCIGATAANSRYTSIQNYHPLMWGCYYTRTEYGHFPPWDLHRFNYWVS